MGDVTKQKGGKVQVSSAVSLIQSLVFKPGWSFDAEDYTYRFEGAIKITVQYPACQSEREEASKGYPTVMIAHADFVMVVADCDTINEICRLLLDDILATIDSHENREFLRVKPTYWAPFHPHRVDGMKAWGRPGDDLHFGLVG